MATFNYAGKDKEGHTVKGTVESSDAKLAMRLLHDKNIMIISLEARKEKNRFFSSFTRTRVPVDDMVVFFRQFSTMIQSGIPVVSSIDILAAQSENETLKKTLFAVRNDINSGKGLSEAITEYPEVFNNLFVSMIKAGESSGTLDVILDRIASYAEKTSSLQKKVKAAMIYPAVVSSMAVIITLVLILKVIPVFKDIFAGFGAELPKATLFLIGLSDIIRFHFFLFIITGVLLFILIKYVTKKDNVRLWIDTVKLKAPIYGPLIKKVAISKFTRTLSTLVKSGVPILSSLEIVAKTAGNLAIERSVKNVREAVKNGEPIADPLERSGIFPSMVVRMVEVGEKSGQLEQMLSKISDFYDTQVDTAVTGLTSMIEPLVIAFLGIVIGGIVLCMFLPIFKLTTIINI